MRIIAGNLKGRKLSPVKGLNTRPTADRVREALFNILGRRPVDAVVLDLFAGTGALGIEALSRGARRAVFVDCTASALSVLHRNIESCRLQSLTRIIKWDITRDLNCLAGVADPFDLVFLDPPYHRAMIQASLVNLLRAGCLAAEALVVVEHDPREVFDPPAAGLACIDQRSYGKTRIAFLTSGPDKPND